MFWRVPGTQWPLYQNGGRASLSTFCSFSFHTVKRAVCDPRWSVKTDGLATLCFTANYLMLLWITHHHHLFPQRHCGDVTEGKDVWTLTGSDKVLIMVVAGMLRTFNTNIIFKKWSSEAKLYVVDLKMLEYVLPLTLLGHVNIANQGVLKGPVQWKHSWKRKRNWRL